MSLWACSGTHFSGGNSSQHPSLLVLITHNKQHRCFLIRWSQRGSHYQLWRKKEGGRMWEGFHKQKRGFLMHTEEVSTINQFQNELAWEVLCLFVQCITRGNTFLGDLLRVLIDLHHIFIWSKAIQWIQKVFGNLKSKFIQKQNSVIYFEDILKKVSALSLFFWSIKWKSIRFSVILDPADFHNTL